MQPYAEGLGAVFLGIAAEIMASFRAQYGVPAEWTPIGAIAIGHPDPDSDLCRPYGRATARPWTSWCTAATGNSVHARKAWRRGNEIRT
jgi:hypothetical protein